MSGVRLLSLTMLACVVCFCALQGRETRGNPQQERQQQVSVTPSPSPIPGTKEKRPNVLRRFFGWTAGQVKRPFRREQLILCDMPPRVDLRASKTSITVCPFIKGLNAGSCSPDREVELVASSVDDDQFRFTWEVTGGTIIGEGRRVSWDLSNLAEGTYIATVEMNTGDGHPVTTSVEVTIAACPNCDPPPPPCPAVTVSGPTDLTAKVITLEATVKGGDPEMQPTFTWTITEGKILGGQGTPKLSVDTSDLGGRAITATVSLGGAHPACTGQEASITIPH